MKTMDTASENINFQKQTMKTIDTASENINFQKNKTKKQWTPPLKV